MSIAAWFVWVSVGCLSSSLQDEDPPRGWEKVTTEHYILFGESGKKIVEYYGQVMELLFRQYSKAFRFKGKLKQKAKVFIHKDRDSYLRGGGSGGSVAYYSPDKKRLVSYENWELLQFLAHEATHQFFDLAFPEFYNNKDVPSWFSEGIAECFCNCQIRGRRRKQIYINVLNTENGWRNVRACRDALQNNQVLPLSEMLSMNERTFASRSGLMYPLSWSFCHFLWNYRRGKYLEVIIRLIEAFKKGMNRTDAYDYAFSTRGKKLNRDKLDAEWRAYLKTLKAKRPPRPKR